MFKKSLLAVAVLGTAAGFACAADVTLYGKVDQGLVFQNTKVQETGKATVKTNQFGLEGGVNSGNRWGLKGKEDLGNGLTVGFKLESGFGSDDGKLGGDRLFHREASMSVSGDFGTLSAGRMGGVGSGSGTYSLLTGTADAFDGGCNGIESFVKTTRYDNMLTYQTPKFAGVQATFQYSFKGNNKTDDKAEDKGYYDASTGREGSAAVDRYAGLGLTGEFGALETVFTYEYLNYASNGKDIGKDDFAGSNKDGLNGQFVGLGGNFDCGFAKTFVGAQYFKDVLDSKDALFYDKKTSLEALTGYAFTLGAVVPVAGGELTAAYYYRDADVDTNNQDGTSALKAEEKYHGFGAKYTYALSKRTTFYTGAGLYQEKSEEKAKTEKTTGYQAFAGLTHAF